MTSKTLLTLVVFGVLTATVVANRPVDAQQFGPAQQVARGGGPVAGNAPRPVQPGGGPQVAPAPIKEPSWIPLTPAMEQYVDQILRYWEYKSSQVKRYRCTFRRWEYDKVFGPQNTFKTYSEGRVLYSAPDKGLFKVEKMQQYEVPKVQGGQPRYVDAPSDQFEHWVCDGHWVWNFDYKNKQLIQTELPPEMRGQSIGKGPLPFLFNAKADDIRSRFWIHAITPKEKKNEYWLEAAPKKQEDLANFKLIRVIIDEADFLPKAMLLFDTSNAGSFTTYEFADREINFSILAEQLNLFHREFYEPAAPGGWTKHVEKWPASGVASDGAATTAQTPLEGSPRR